MFSHRWGAKEPTFRDMPSKIHGDWPAPDGSGYRKLLRVCEKAKEYGCDFIWSDTCCINKESSAELDEAIRSMCRWYSDAYVCIAYLTNSSSVDDFPHEPWFTRGWTLQELLAPERLRMFGRDWHPICPEAKEMQAGPYELALADCHNDKKNAFMVKAISKVTGIKVSAISPFNWAAGCATVAEKITWASKRRTTRVEDMAYSLFGIFDVTMPIAYGEGKMAFRRLLEAIAHRYEDATFFAWSGSCSPYSSALPSSPACYTKPPLGERGDMTFTIQKHGVQVKLLVMPVHFVPSGNYYTLRPIDTELSDQIAITGQFSEPMYGPEEDYAVGVVNYHWPNDTPDSDRNSYGLLRAKRYYFCVVMNPLSGWTVDRRWVTAWKVETGSILPMIECQNNYTDDLS